MITFKQFQKKASKSGLIAIDHGNGHWQLRGGPLVVNYYPTSKRQTVYVCGTNGGTNFATIDDAISAVTQAPDLKSHLEKTVRSRVRAKSFKKKLLSRGNCCHWCGECVDLSNATVDHVIPLARGGLDNMNNVVLACAKCNRKRGCEMPELNHEN